MTIMTPRVADISHHNVVTDFGAAAAAGLWGVIHKATQGRAYHDPDYGARRAAATAAGLLWGAYHFNTGDSVRDQVEFFVKTAQPGGDTLMVLDYEDNRLSQMNMTQAVEFLRRIEGRLGRKAAIYSGNRLKETIGSVPQADRDYVCSHRLWLCQYGPRAVLPSGFARWWLWQYTGDGIGQEPHGIAGIQGHSIDLNAFDGTREQLVASWSGHGQTTVPVAPHVGRGTVITQGLNLRAEASTVSAVLEVLRRDAVVEIVETTDDGTPWLRVNVQSGKSGWVSGRYVRTYP